jgi:hypothetical protein
MGKDTHPVTRTTARRQMELGAFVVGVLAVTAITVLVMRSKLHHSRDGRPPDTVLNKSVASVMSSDTADTPAATPRRAGGLFPPATVQGNDYGHNAFPSSPAPKTGTGDNMPEGSVEYEAQYAAAVVEVTVRSISEQRANTASGEPPTAVPGSLITDPTSENALYKTLVLDIDTIYHSESSPPDGWVIPVYSGTTANGPPTRSDIPRLPLDVNDVHVGDKALVFLERNPWRISEPCDSYAETLASQLSSGDDDYDTGLLIYSWYLIVDNTVVDGLSQHVFSLDNLRSRLVAFFAPTVTPTSTSTATSTPSPTPTPTPTPASFEPVADSYTLSTQPTQNYGTQSVLDVRGSSGPFYRSYLKFNVSEPIFRASRRVSM